MKRYFSVFHHIILAIFSGFFLIFYVSEALAQEVLIPIPKQNPPADKAVLYVVTLSVEKPNDDLWPHLKWAGSDADGVEKSFGKNTSYKVENISLSESQASIEKIRAVLRDLQQKVRPQDAVAVYYSGHGTLARAPSGEIEPYFVLTNTKRNDLSKTGFNQAEIRQKISSMRANKKLLIIAACQSGAGKSRNSKEIEDLLSSRKGTLAPIESVSEGIIVLAASARNEAAREDDTLKGDVYTHFFLEGLRIYDRNKDGAVSALEAHDYAREKTWQHSNGKQRPTVESVEIGDADFSLYGRKTRTGTPILEGYRADLNGFEVAVNQRAKGTLPSAFELNSGVNIIEIYTPGAEFPLGKYKVNATEGDSFSVEDIVAAPKYFAGFGINADRQSGEEHPRDLLYLSSSGASVWLGRRWDLGSAEILYRNQFTRAQFPKPNVRAETREHSLLLKGRLNHQPFPYFLMGSGLQVSGNWSYLSVKDTLTKEKLSFNSVAPGYGFFLGAEFYPRSRWGFTSELSWEARNFKYKEVGERTDNRWSVLVGMAYRFGLVGELL